MPITVQTIQQSGLDLAITRARTTSKSEGVRQMAKRLPFQWKPLFQTTGTSMNMLERRVSPRDEDVLPGSGDKMSIVKVGNTIEDQVEIPAANLLKVRSQGRKRKAPASIEHIEDTPDATDPDFKVVDSALGWSLGTPHCRVG